LITNAIHLHLVLNHFPILGTLFGLLLFLAGLVIRDSSLRRAGLVTLILMALLTPAVYITGESAEELLEKMPQFPESYVEKHEEAARIALVSMLATGFLALLALLRGGSKKLQTLTFLLAALTLALMVLVGNYGGKIRHSEIRGDIPSYIEEED